MGKNAKNPTIFSQNRGLREHGKYQNRLDGKTMDMQITTEEKTEGQKITTLVSNIHRDYDENELLWEGVEFLLRIKEEVSKRLSEDEAPVDWKDEIVQTCVKKAIKPVLKVMRSERTSPDYSEEYWNRQDEELVILLQSQLASISDDLESEFSQIDDAEKKECNQNPTIKRRMRQLTQQTQQVTSLLAQLKLLRQEMTIERIRKAHEGKNWNDDGSSFAETVQKEIQEIRKEKRNENIHDWGKSCRGYREYQYNNFTVEFVSSALKVTPKVINDQENIHGITNVDLFYLEAFSYLYHTSPYCLLNIMPDEAREYLKKENEETHEKRRLVYAIIPLDRELARYQDIILQELYKPDEPIKIKHLQWINLVLGMTEHTRSEFFKILEGSKKYCKLLNGDIDSYSVTSQTYEYRGFLKYKDRFTWNYTCQYTLYDTLDLSDRMIRDGDRSLRKIAIMAIAGDEALNSLYEAFYESGKLYGNNTMKKRESRIKDILDIPDKEDKEENIRPQVFPDWLKMLRTGKKNDTKSEPESK